MCVKFNYLLSRQSFSVLKVLAKKQNRGIFNMPQLTIIHKKLMGYFEWWRNQVVIYWIFLHILAWASPTKHMVCTVLLCHIYSPFSPYFHNLPKAVYHKRNAIKGQAWACPFQSDTWYQCPWPLLYVSLKVGWLRYKARKQTDEFQVTIRSMSPGGSLKFSFIQIFFWVSAVCQALCWMLGI